jgi:hypothetical protein
MRRDRPLGLSRFALLRGGMMLCLPWNGEDEAWNVAVDLDGLF